MVSYAGITPQKLKHYLWILEQNMFLVREEEAMGLRNAVEFISRGGSIGEIANLPQKLEKIEHSTGVSFANPPEIPEVATNDCFNLFYDIAKKHLANNITVDHWRELDGVKSKIDGGGSISDFPGIVPIIKTIKGAVGMEHSYILPNPRRFIQPAGAPPFTLPQPQPPSGLAPSTTEPQLDCRIIWKTHPDIILTDRVLNYIASTHGGNLDNWPNGEIKGIIAYKPYHGTFLAFDAIITSVSPSASVTSSDEEENLFEELTREHRDLKFELFHSHPDWIRRASAGDFESFRKCHATSAYFNRFLLFYRNENGGLGIRQYKMAQGGTGEVSGPINYKYEAKLSRYHPEVTSFINRKSSDIRRSARRHGF